MLQNQIYNIYDNLQFTNNYLVEKFKFTKKELGCLKILENISISYLNIIKYNVALKNEMLEKEEMEKFVQVANKLFTYTDDGVDEYGPWNPYFTFNIRVTKEIVVKLAVKAKQLKNKEKIYKNLINSKNNPELENIIKEEKEVKTLIDEWIK